MQSTQTLQCFINCNYVPENIQLFFLFRESPPYYAYGLACLQFLIGGLYWTAAQKYANKVAPPSLVGTMTGIVGSVNWIIAKGDTKILHKPIFRKKIRKSNNNDQLKKIP